MGKKKEYKIGLAKYRDDQAMCKPVYLSRDEVIQPTTDEVPDGIMKSIFEEAK